MHLLLTAYQLTAYSSGMCGIAGYVGSGSREILQRMTDVISHRGPDDSGFFVQGRVGLGMRRLAIIDVQGGTQPIFSEDRSVAVVFNGEIYNFRELREELQRAGHTFTTQSDTEVIAHGYEAEGSGIFGKLNGMFAVALWDARRGQLVLARDRMGKKPLYWGQWQGTLVFGSEPKAMLPHPAVRRALDWQSLGLYLTHEYVPTPRAIYQGMRKLDEGAVLTYRPGASPEVRRYWSLPRRVERLRLAEALPRLDTLLADAVKRRLIADVPLGVFLSGGIDSSTVAYYAQAVSRKAVKTFSIGFAESSYDESSFARRVAQHLGTDHHEQILRPQLALELIPKLGDLLDEPLADPSILPTYLLSKFARQQVTVAISGDGGDELFLGYPTFQAERIAGWLRVLPRSLRCAVADIAGTLRPKSYDYQTWRYRLQRFTAGLCARDSLRHLVWLGAFAPHRLPQLLTAEAHAQLDRDVLADVADRLPQLGAGDWWQQLTAYYLRGYLEDEVLVKVDRASMYASLEVRAPFLDYRIVEFVASLPPALRLKRWQTKYVLKQLMAGRLPAATVHRNKQGFAVPVGSWLRGELKPLALDLLSTRRLQRQGIFQPASVQRLLSGHLEGRADHRKELWTLMVFQLWWDRWMG